MATALNAISLALSEASVPLKRHMAASGACIIPDRGLVVDPTRAEVAESLSEHLFSFDTMDWESIVCCQSRGVYKEQDLSDARDLCAKAAQKAAAFAKLSLESMLVREYAEG